MVDPDIQRAIEIIDNKIQSLQQARNQLAQAFGVDSSSPTFGATLSPTPKTVTPLIVSTAQKPRKEALAEFLRAHGPMPRTEIVAKAGLPEGTISYCLSDKRFFEQLDDGNWAVTDFSRRGLDMKSSNGHLPSNQS